MTETDALQAALAGEHAAVYAYGVVGARLEGRPDERAAQSGYDAHRQRRSTITRLLVDSGATPTPAAAAYDLGGTVATPAAARTLAALVETRVAATYADVVASADAGLRSTAALWVADAAVRATSWSGTPPTFPGLPERSG
jgi:Domain of unknown function (DUF4439)